MANEKKQLNKTRERRKRRTRAKIFGTSDKPRLSVFRSSRYVYAQLIDDSIGKTVVGVSTRELGKSKDKEKKSRVLVSGQLGELVAEKALEKGIKKAVFDRGNYKYHGRIKAVAEGARKGGLQF